MGTLYNSTGQRLDSYIAREVKGEEARAIADFRKVLEMSQDPALRQEAEARLQALGAGP